MSGQIPHRSDILNITNAFPCEVQTTTEHGYHTFDFVRFTQLNGGRTQTPNPQPLGSDPINNNKYRIIVTGLDTFTLQDPITFKPIDSTNYPPYITGGFCNKLAQNYFYHAPEDQEDANDENSDEDRDEDQTQE